MPLKIRRWTDRTWNPVTGCLNTCYYCYARRAAQRHASTTQGKNFQPEMHASRLEQPLKILTSQKICVCSMGDLLGDWIPSAWIDAVVSIARRAERHTFQFLTRNPIRYLDFEWPANAWLGATAVDQLGMDEAGAFLQGFENNVCYVNVEPMLAPITLTEFTPDWIIIGAQTGPHSWVPKEKWIESLSAQAIERNIPLFHKQSLRQRSPSRQFPAR